ncbi:MAG: ABC transporter substrate-binding protein, partial [Hyphomicrobiaceae bacterium]|nr:ABC transporter substrate-binding protein [Hyphomicrobiaceae bacterium]
MDRNRHTPHHPRVVSLVPSATELLRHLGVEPVGISHCCENLDTGAAVLTSSIVPDGLSQGEIDRFVSAASAKGESLYRVNEALLDRLRPDIIFTQGVCDVCAVGAEEVARANACLASETPTVFLNGTTLEDLYTDIAIVGDGIGRDVSAEIEDLRARVEAVRAAVAGHPKPRVAFVEWLEPPFLGGHWVPDMIAAAGAIPIGPASGVPSPRSTWSEIASEQPDVLLFSF